jgi:uncharacterized protein HemX
VRIRTLLLLLVLLATAAFVIINWTAVTTPTRLSLLVTTVEAPIGLVMLTLVILVVLAFGTYVLVWQSAVMVESRRQTKELQLQRNLADQAEASRFTELRGILHDEIETLANRMGQMQETLRSEIRENTNSLSATIAELDDRMQRSREGGVT